MSSVTAQPWALPRWSLRWMPVWRRNFLVWRKLAIPSVVGNFIDPMLFMLGLGYGLGQMLPEIDGVPYLNFLAAGTLCYSTMNSATFEALYSAFSRMHVQKTWDGILNAPIMLDDVLLAEWLWAASKALLSGLAILVVISLMGLAQSPLILWAIPLALLIGLCFAGLGLVVNALAPNYDFFMYYFTLVISPMMLMSGVFFPVQQLPELLQHVSSALPLRHAIDLVRPLMVGKTPDHIALSVLVLLGYGVSGLWLGTVLTRRRLLR